MKMGTLFTSFDPKSLVNAFEKTRILRIGLRYNFSFFSLESPLFYPEYQLTVVLGLFPPKKQR